MTISEGLCGGTERPVFPEELLVAGRALLARENNADDGIQDLRDELAQDDVDVIAFVLRTAEEALQDYFRQATS